MMPRRILVPISIIVIFSMLVSTSAYAWTYSVKFVYYSDSGFTSPEGEEYVPGICCPEDERHHYGDIETAYRIVYFYYDCGWMTETGVPNCQAYYGSSWHLVPCP